MKKPNKKGQAFETINAGMISFIGFAMLTLLVILLVSTVKQTDIVCSGTITSGVCFQCNATYTGYNSTYLTCHNATGENISATVDISSAYNGTVAMQEAADLPPQFAQIVVIVLIIVGILGMLGAIGYGAYQKIKN